MLSMAIMVGVWSTTCIQTQISNVNSGYVKETYKIEKSGDFEFERKWFRDPSCTEPNGTDTESGTVEIGKELRGLFYSDETYEANFNSQQGIDLGAISVKENKYLKVARGVRNSSMRNTMLGLFDYIKQ